MTTLSKASQQEWSAHIEAWRISGLTQQAYCKEHGLTPHQFWYWKSKLKPSAKTRKKQSPDNNKFVPVNVSSPTTTASNGLVLSLPNGITLSDITQENMLVAQKLVEALR